MRHLHSTYLLAAALILLTLIACKNQQTQQHNQAKSESTYEVPDNYVQIKEAQPRENINKHAKVYKIEPRAYEVHWKADRLQGAAYQGVFKIGRGVITLTPEKQIETAKVSLIMGTLRVTNASQKERPMLQAHLKGLVKGKEGWGFSVNDYPYGLLEIIDHKTIDGKNIFIANLTLKGTTRSLHIPGSIKLIDKQSLKLQIEPFSIDLRKWYILFDNQELMSPYMQLTLQFRANTQIGQASN